MKGSQPFVQEMKCTIGDNPIGTAIAVPIYGPPRPRTISHLLVAGDQVLELPAIRLCARLGL